MHCTHPRCWQWRFPAHGQCFLGPSSWTFQDNSSIRWLEAPKQRSRSMGLVKHTGKSRAEHMKKPHRCIYCDIDPEAFTVLYLMCCTVPLWKAQQRSGRQSAWCWQVVPGSPLVAFWLHWPQTHKCSPQHSSSLVQGCKDGEKCFFVLLKKANIWANIFHLVQHFYLPLVSNGSLSMKSAVACLVKYKWDQQVNWSLIAVRQVPIPSHP